MLKLTGEEQYESPRETIWAKLTDLTFLVDCIPDVSKVREIQDKTAALTLKPGFSFVRGEMKLNIEKTEETPPESASMLLKTKAIGSHSEVVADFNLEEQAGGTALQWAVEIKQLGGLLKAVPKSLIQAGASKVVGDLLSNFKAKLK